MHGLLLKEKAILLLVFCNISLKPSKRAIKQWNKEKFGNIFDRKDSAENDVCLAEQAFDSDPTEGNRTALQSAQAKYRKCMHLEDIFWGQKAKLNWLQQGDRNSKFYQLYVKQRRARMAIHRIKLNNGEWCEDENEIKVQAVKFFEQQFKSEEHHIQQYVLDQIPCLINEEENKALINVPDGEEIKEAVHSLSPDSSPGPDGYTGKFFTQCWGIISEDVIHAVQGFFHGMPLPIGTTSSLIALIPKVISPSSFSEMRPISLCNFTYKVISKIISNRMVNILPKIISENQGAFVKGRNIIDKISLVTEMMKELSRKTRGHNLILKLDMAKAYARMEWDFLIAVMNAFGFLSKFCSLIYMMLNNCWFFVLYNGAPTGFLKSSGGVRQGDPLAPALFIIAEEALSCGISHLFNSGQIQAYKVPRGCKQITHLLYVDDTLVFLNGMADNFKRLMQFLKDYENVSGQKVNSSKSTFLISQKAVPSVIKRIADRTCHNHKTGLQSYLGVLLFEGRKRTSHYKYLIDKICKRLDSWQSKFFSQAGRLCLINSVLQSIPIYSASASCIPATVIEMINKICANFFWCGRDGARRHWVSWANVARPIEEGGLGIKSLKHIQIAMVAKQLWRIITGTSLWSQYAKGRYIRGRLCNIVNPFPSGVRKNVFNKTKEIVVSNTRLVPMDGSTIDILRDNWCGIALDPQASLPKVTLRDAITNPNHMVWSYIPDRLQQKVKSIQLVQKPDMCVWALNSDGLFTCKSAFNEATQQGIRRQPLKKIWGIYIPLKISLFCWRVLNLPVPVDQMVKSSGICIPSKCVCCNSNFQEESMTHLLLESDIAKPLWVFFRTLFDSHCSTSFSITGFCWDVLRTTDSHSLMGYAAINTMIHILWEVWKVRCKLKYEEKGTSTRVLQQKILQNTQLSTRHKYFNKAISASERYVLHQFNFECSIVVRSPKVIKWICPKAGVALNIDGASKGNPGYSCGGGCIRGCRGEFLYGFSYFYGVGSNMVAETRALLDGLRILVFEVMKSCIKAAQDSSKLSSLIQEILLCDSSVHSVLFRAFCIKTHVLEGLYVNRVYDLREIEGLQSSVCSALEVTFAMLRDLWKETSSGVPVFVQSVLSSTSKPIPVITATASLISFSRNSAIQVEAARVLSMLCFMSGRMQQYSSENAFSVLDDMQLKDLRSSIYEILNDEEMKSEDLLISVISLLTSAARFQPAFLASIILSMDGMETPSNTAEVKHQVVIGPADGSSGTRESPLNSIMQYINKSKNLFERSPRLLLSIFSLIKALWNGNAQYLQILEIFRGSEFFWKKMSSPITDMEDKCGSLAESVNYDQILCLAYRYQCEAAILGTIAQDIFLHKKVLHDEITEKQITEPDNGPKVIFSTKMAKVQKKTHSKDILSKWCESSTVVSRIKSYSTSRYPEEIIHRAKVEVVLCVVHMMAKLSSGDAGSLSLALVQKILTVSKKLTEQPAFSALVQGYSVYGYSGGNEASIVVLTDLYYHVLGELEGRVISPGHFKEVFHYLLAFDIFQHYECKYDRDLWPPENGIYMFDIKRLRADLGMELWDHSDWKSSKSIAERMLSVMHHTNLVKFLAHSKNSALRALTCLSSIHSRNLDETQPASLGEGISEPLLLPSIEHLCQCLQTAKGSLLPTMIPSEDSLKFLATQVELLLNLSKSLLISYRHSTNAAQLHPMSLLLIRTSDIALRLLSDVRQSTILQKVVKFLLTLLLTSMKIIYPISSDKLDSLVDPSAEASLLSLGLLPVLCKYAETSEHCNLSVAAIDLILKGFSTPTTWLPVLRNHLHLQLIIHKLQQQDRLGSVAIIFKFLLTLARTKGGAEMLRSANAFQSLKVLLTLFLKDEPYSSNIEVFSIHNTMFEEEDLKHIWGLGLAISASMICSLGDDITCTELVGNAIRYFFSEKASLMYYHLSFPKFPSDDHSEKKARVQKSQTSLTALKETEYALILTCILAKHQNVWTKEMKGMDTELRETIIHMLAFISKGALRVGDSLNRTPLLLCPPMLKEELTSHRRLPFVESKHGWFTLAALGSAPQNKSSALSSTHLSVGTKKQANENTGFHQSHFSDTIAVQIYRISFLLLKFLCTQARVATKRAEEVEYIDLAHFPELPMPEILHGIQDQSIVIVTEICQANRSREIQPESRFLCLLLLQILEKSLYLELCVSQSCGIRPVSGRVEDFSKEIKMLIEVVDRYPPFKASFNSLKQIIALVYPGMLQTSSIL